ncbi:MAG: MBL fold metallo-hydrolase [Bacteroidetes bacterium SB0662_bin_6]|nr:MBL fold metallo-hydrolase [Bacteroidetes bacterium SB0668_bin_1]MYE04131.1 MBL fold metallo-hydrolase [Bacteroidetes bacterium SB0662_bin_6]
MTRSLIFAMLFSALPVMLPVAAQDLAVSPVAGSIHMINGQGGNIGVSVGADGFLMVDDKFAPLADQIRARLEGLGEGELKFLLNTHFHGDHTGGNEVFGVETPIIAHHNVRTRLMTEQRRGDRVTPPAPPAAWPVITFDDAISIHFNGEEVKVLHIPHAHTDGDALIFFTGSNVVHMGDTFFNQRFPFVDIDSGGAVEGVIAAGRAVLAHADDETRIIPGHGPVASPSDLETYLRMIEETRAAVAAGIEAGHSLEELQAAGTGDEWASWGDGFISTERWIATLHRDLTE